MAALTDCSARTLRQLRHQITSTSVPSAATRKLWVDALDYVLREIGMDEDPGDDGVEGAHRRLADATDAYTAGGQSAGGSVSALEFGVGVPTQATPAGGSGVGSCPAEIEAIGACIHQLEIRADEMDKDLLAGPLQRLTALAERGGREIKLWDLFEAGDLDVRGVNVCHDAGFKTLGDVADMGRQGIWRVKNLGRKTRNVLDGLLQEAGVSWAAEALVDGRWRVLK
jgi:hypothetical protein